MPFAIFQTYTRAYDEYVFLNNRPTNSICGHFNNNKNEFHIQMVVAFNQIHNNSVLSPNYVGFSARLGHSS